MPSFLVSITASTTINSEANSIVNEEFIDYPADVATQGAVTQLFFKVFLMFLACLDHARWAEFHLGILKLELFC